MDPKTTYKTKQRDLLLTYLRTVPGEHITASDICLHFKRIGINIGMSTVYRQLERLVDEGTVKKYIIDSNSPACFEYEGSDNEANEVCFHCKCIKCGKVIHLKCSEIQHIQEHLYEEHRFKMSGSRTVFYGLCEDCANKAETND